MDPIFTKEEKSNRPLILAVDDHTDNLMVLTKYLAAKGYDVITARTGLQAVDSAKENKPDLILLDFAMPGMQGDEVCKILKNSPDTESIPVIFVTVMKDFEFLKSAFSSGAVDFITKPYHPEELIIRINTQLKLKQSLEYVEKANKDKDRFLAVLSHDLKSPLSGILGLVGVLETEYQNLDTEQLSEVIKSLKLSLDNHYMLLEELLLWGKIQRGIISAPHEILDLSLIIESRIETLSHLASLKNIILKKEYEKNLFSKVDKNMIGSVIQNLVSNAVKFSDCGGLITINAYHNDGINFIEVTDDGIGISDEELLDLFNPDVIRSTPGTNNEQGTGLGLLLCKEMVEMNGGRLRAESVFGEGSKFMVALPACTPEIIEEDKI